MKRNKKARHQMHPHNPTQLKYKLTQTQQQNQQQNQLWMMIPPSNPLAKQRFKEAGENVIKNKREEERGVKKDLYKGMLDEVEKVNTEVDQIVATTKEEAFLEEMPLKKDKKESINEIIENEKQLYLSFRMKTGEVPRDLSLENDIPTIYEKAKEKVQNIMMLILKEIRF